MYENYIGSILENNNNKYKIIKKIGSGGMSVVFEGFDITHNRSVAIKVLKEDYLEDEDYIRRFWNECEIIKNLDNPNIVELYDYNMDGSFKFIVMEYVEGTTLENLISNTPSIPIVVTCRIITQVLIALQCAHDAGVIHRDIKPSNIMIRKDGNIKVMDFGIARIAVGNKTRTATNLMTPQYMSPEQPGGHTDRRSDIYSLGLILYELLTGRYPYKGYDYELYIQHLYAEPERPRSIRPDIPSALEQITLRAIQKDPDFRYQSASEMLTDMEIARQDPTYNFGYSLSTGGNPDYLDTINKPNNVKVSPPSVEQQPTAVKEPEPEPPAKPVEDDDFHDNKKSGVSVGVLVAVFVLLLAGVGILGYNIYRNYFSTPKTEVPNFIGQPYEQVISQYSSKFTFESVPQYKYNTEYADGVVCEQSVAAGELINSDKTIRLTVAASSEAAVVPEVTGKMYSTAESILKSRGFVVVTVPVEDPEKEDGYIVRTDPAANTTVAAKSTITVYVVSGSGTVKVPDLIGKTRAEAVSALDDLKFKVTVKIDASEADKKGLVIAQTPEADTDSVAGSEVTITVGSGVPAEKECHLTVSLPDDSDLSVQLVCYLNDAVVTRSNVILDGSDYKITFSGSGSSDSFKVYLANALYEEGTIDFTKDSPKATVTATHEWSSSNTSVPDVVGMTLEEATKELKGSGFNNINVVYRDTAAYAEGYVISQTPAAGKPEPSQTEITIVISRAVTETTTVQPTVVAPTTTRPVTTREDING
ncbi:MAG: Stk1 family PASTA domain-containing Ser/Thr kinase [Clostridia bacterium]|nr:Stk1 family PASTA domain-containing Ser/Thr kinase [Clostridia bacterium]